MKNLANIYYMQQVDETPNKLIKSSPLNNSPNSNTISLSNNSSKIISLKKPSDLNDTLKTISTRKTFILDDNEKPKDQPGSNEIESADDISRNISTTNKQILELYNTANKSDYLKSTTKTEVDKNMNNTIEDLIFKDLEENTKEMCKIEQENDERSKDHQSETKIIEPIIEIDNLKPLKHNFESNSLNRTESDQSIASTLTNSSQITTNKSKQKEVEVAEELPEWLILNAAVIVSTNSVMNKPGIVRYIGPAKFAGGTWIGVELEQAFGKNDGSIKGKSYFKCEENKGVFVRPDKLTLVVKQN